MEIQLAIVGADLIDGSGTEPIPASAVLVGVDGRIVATGHREQLDIPDGTPVLDGTGFALLPGLIDGHQHLTWDKTMYSPRAIGQNVAPLQNPERQLVRAGHYAQMALAAGVTTLRDCGADDFSVLALRDMINAGNFIGPRILASGRPITTTAGHLYTDWGVDSSIELKKAVRALASQGVDFVKLMLSGGTTSPGTNITHAQYSLDELRVVVDEARRLGLPVAVHALSADSIRLAAEAGVDTIEHCSWIGRDPRTTTPDEGVVSLMLEHHVRVDHAIVPRPYLFPEELPGLMSAEEQWWLSMLQVRWPFLHTMRQRGVTVFLGSDAGYGMWPGTGFWPGFQDFGRALEVMVRWAMFSPLQVIAMATGEAAQALGLERELGTVQPGKRADLILVAGNPLSDLQALRNVVMVFRDGKLVANKGQIVLRGAHGGQEGLRGWELPG